MKEVHKQLMQQYMYVVLGRQYPSCSDEDNTTKHTSPTDHAVHPVELGSSDDPARGAPDQDLTLLTSLRSSPTLPDLGLRELDLRVVLLKGAHNGVGARLVVGQVDEDASWESPQHSVVKVLRSVGGAEHQHAVVLRRGAAVELEQELGLDASRRAVLVLRPLAEDRVELI